MLDVEGAAQAWLEKLCVQLGEGMYQARSAATRQAASYIKKNAAPFIQSRYDISTANLRMENAVRVSYSFGKGSIAGILNFSGAKIPLYRYNGAAPSVPTRNAATYGHILKSSSPIRFPHAFVARMKSGHIGIFSYRKKNKDARTAIREKMGLSVPQMMASEGVRGRIEPEINRVFWESFEQKAIEALAKGGK